MSEFSEYDLPSGWIVTTIGTLVEQGLAHLQTGPFGTALLASEYTDQGTPVVAVKNIRENVLLLADDTPRVSEETRKRLERYELKVGDIVFGRKGAVERRALITQNEQGWLQGSDCIRLRFFTSDLDPHYVSYFLGSPQQSSWMQRHAVGSTMLSLNQDVLKRIVLFVPPLQEQKAIASILSTWDEAITFTEALIEALQQRKQSLMQLLLTGEVRFPSFIESSEYQEAEFGLLPSDWQYLKIGDIARLISERNSEGDELPVLSCTKYDGLVDSLEYFGRQIYSEDLSTYKLVHEGQFAYATNHIEEGSIGYQDLYPVALISPMYTVFETTQKVHDPYLYAVLKTELYRYIFEINTSASVDRRGSLRWPQFSQIKVPLPKMEEQKAISECLQTHQEVIKTYKAFASQLQQQKQALMQQLLTGTIHLKERSDS